MPDDVTALIEKAGNLRDRALLAVMASTGGRIGEILNLRLRDIKQSNGGFQVWFGETKVKSQERYSPKIEGAWKKYLDAWLNAHPFRNSMESWLFPSTTVENKAVGDGTVSEILVSLSRKAGVKKDTNPHAFRHARITWGVINEENTAKLCIGIWGKPSSQMLNHYTHFAGLDTKIGSPRELELPSVPALPVPLMLQTQKQVSELTAEMERMKELFRRQTDFYEWALANPDAARDLKGKAESH
jgi:hypothetical protein